jgi:type IV pilus assembly protein PilA
MQETLRRIQARRAAGDQGFTLIELLVVVVIIGVLVGISIPLYMNYSNGAKNKSAQSDVRGAITGVEQYYSDKNTYPASKTSTEGVALDLGGQKMSVSSGNTLGYQNNGASYTLCAFNKDTNEYYRYDSAAGGSVAKSSASGMTGCLAPSAGGGATPTPTASAGA